MNSICKYDLTVASLKALRARRNLLFEGCCWLDYRKMLIIFDDSKQIIIRKTNCFCKNSTSAFRKGLIAEIGQLLLFFRFHSTTMRIFCYYHRVWIRKIGFYWTRKLVFLSNVSLRFIDTMSICQSFWGKCWVRFSFWVVFTSNNFKISHSNRK